MVIHLLQLNTKFYGCTQTIIRCFFYSKIQNFKNVHKWSFVFLKEKFDILETVRKRPVVLSLWKTKFSKLYPNGHSFFQQRNTRFNYLVSIYFRSLKANFLKKWVWDILFHFLTFEKGNTDLWIPNFACFTKKTKLEILSNFEHTLFTKMIIEI